MTEQTQDNTATAGTAPAESPKPRKPRGSYKTKKKQAAAAAANVGALPAAQASPRAFNFIRSGHAAIMAAYRAQRVFGIQRKPTEAERILERHIRETMADLAPMCTDGGDEK